MNIGRLLLNSVWFLITTPTTTTNTEKIKVIKVSILFTFVKSSPDHTSHTFNASMLNLS